MKNARPLAHFGFLHAADREPQRRELLFRDAEKEIALIAIGVGGAREFRAVSGIAPLHVMACHQKLGIEVLGGLEQIVELDFVVARDARDRRFAGDVAFGERVDHLRREAGLVVEHVVRNAERLGDMPRVMNVLTGTAASLSARRRSVVIELQRHADDLVAGSLHHRGGDGAVDPARHRNDDALSGARGGNGLGLGGRSSVTSLLRFGRMITGILGRIISGTSGVSKARIKSGSYLLRRGPPAHLKLAYQ